MPWHTSTAIGLEVGEVASRACSSAVAGWSLEATGSPALIPGDSLLSVSAMLTLSITQRHLSTQVPWSPGLFAVPSRAELRLPGQLLRAPEWERRSKEGKVAAASDSR